MLQIAAIIGEIMVLAGAVLWLPLPDSAPILLTAGAVLFALGRCLGSKGDVAMWRDRANSLWMRRLYGQRIVGLVFLLLAASSIHLGNGFYYGVYIRRSFWLLPFIIFVVFEAYTAFRIPDNEKSVKSGLSV